MLNFRIARASAKTGTVLQEMVKANLLAEGFTQDVNAEICFGAGYSGDIPALNAKCSTYNKLQQAKILRAALGENALDVFDNVDTAEGWLKSGHGPLFARTLVHSKGKDIKLVLEDWQVQPLMSTGSSFFTPHVPSVYEFRTWIYRKRHLGSYIKVLTRPQDCKRLGRNYGNGFDFSGLERDEIEDGLIDVSRKAIAALGLDFGAVDVLRKEDGTYVVLEVNSAPGVSNERRKVIKNLAKRITKWIIADYPARSNSLES